MKKTSRKAGWGMKNMKIDANGTEIRVVGKRDMVESELENGLKDKLTIGVFSSSSPISATVPVRYKRGKEYLQSKGIDVVDGILYKKQD